jgi:alpha-L-fucosidase
MRLLFAAIILAAASGQPQLLFSACNSSDARQSWALVGGTVRPASDASSCATFAGGSYDAPLVLQPCVAGAASQAWFYDAGNATLLNPPGSCAGAGGACLQWSGQERSPCVSTPPALGAGCMMGVWPAQAPTTWNNALEYSPSSGAVQALFARAGGPSPSGLCVTAVAPPAPPVPSPVILSWAAKRVGCLYDFDLSVFSSTPQGCNCGAAPPPADAWAPTALDAESWLAAGVAAGCERHILVAKHVCGFLSWNSTAVPGYNFSTAYSATPVDAVAAFAAAVRRRGAPLGLYYSLTNNARTNTCGGVIGPNPQPGQITVTEAQYDALVLAHLTELWTNYGDIEEAWFDGGTTASLTPAVQALLARLQPNAVGFNGGGFVANPSRWIGSESGYAPDPTWSTCDLSANGAGDPDSRDWYPAETDFTTLAGDTWFYQEGVPVRPPAQLRAMYEGSVGRNTVALIGIGIPPNGSLAGTEQAAALAGLGAYVRGCYGAPPAAQAANASAAAPIVLTLGAPAAIDRVVVDEDQTAGQLVRGFTLDVRLANGTTLRVDAGRSVGNRRITALPAPLMAVAATLTVTQAAAPGARIALFALFAGCGDLARELDGARQ